MVCTLASPRGTTRMHLALWETTAVPGDDSPTCDEYVQAFTKTLPPQSDVERALIEQAAQSLVAQTETLRTQNQRITANIENAPLREAEEAEQLLERLFHYPGGPIEQFGSLGNSPKRWRAYWRRADVRDDPDLLVFQLERSSAGLKVMIKEWAELRALLEDGGVWQPHHKLKAVRLLGRQPWEIEHHSGVLDIFVASWSLYPKRDNPFFEFASEHGPAAYQRVVRTIRLSWRNRLGPYDPDDARAVLLSLVDRAVTGLQAKLAEAEAREEQEAPQKLALLSFDFSPEGERLRRLEQKHFNAFMSALDELIEPRRKERASLPAAARGKAAAGAPISGAEHRGTEIQDRDDDHVRIEEETIEPPDIRRLPERPLEAIGSQGLPVGVDAGVIPPAQLIGSAPGSAGLVRRKRRSGNRAPSYVRRRHASAPRSRLASAVPRFGVPVGAGSRRRSRFARSLA